MSDRKPVRWVAWVAAVVVLIGGYVGAYYAIVQMSPGYFSHRKESRFGRKFFAPIHWFDRRTRPELWEPKR